MGSRNPLVRARERSSRFLAPVQKLAAKLSSSAAGGNSGRDVGDGDADRPGDKISYYATTRLDWRIKHARDGAETAH